MQIIDFTFYPKYFQMWITINYRCLGDSLAYSDPAHFFELSRRAIYQISRSETPINLSHPLPPTFLQPHASKSSSTVFSLLAKFSRGSNLTRGCGNSLSKVKVPRNTDLPVEQHLSPDGHSWSLLQSSSQLEELGTRYGHCPGFIARHAGTEGQFCPGPQFTSTRLQASFGPQFTSWQGSRHWHCLQPAASEIQKKIMWLVLFWSYKIDDWLE